MDKTSCTSSDYGFTRSIRQGDNPNKETLIYIPHITCRHHLGSTTWVALRVTEL